MLFYFYPIGREGGGGGEMEELIAVVLLLGRDRGGRE